MLNLQEARVCVELCEFLASCSTVIIWSMNERMCLLLHKLNIGNGHVLHSLRTDDTKDCKREMVAHSLYVTMHCYCSICI